MSQTFKIIGLMSGTSMDGIDVSFIETDGDLHVKIISNYYIEYNKNEKKILLDIQEKYLTGFAKKKDETIYNEIITNFHYQVIKKIYINDKIDFVGFHGQTVLHNAKKKISLQLGNPQKLSNLTNLKVISCFRADDINKGGQGAPLAPIFHKFLIEKNKLELPSLFLNIGGVSNITYYDKEHLIGFDAGPGNGLIDLYMRSKFNKKFDQNGENASNGIINEQFVKKFKLNKYHTLSYPKSLDIMSFKKEYNELLSYDLKDNDILSTLTELTVISIQNSLEILPKKIKNFVIVGGGLHNKYLINRLNQTIDAKFIFPKEISLDEDFVESQMIAYISARKINNLPVTFPLTTGVSQPLVIGKIFYPIKNH